MKFRRTIAIGFCGIMLGTTMSVLSASPATGRVYAKCDQRVAGMERQAAAKYQSGELSGEAYGKVQSEIAKQQTRWGC